MVDVAIIGAGPYGLSIATHLAERRIDFRIFGRLMELWEHHMPTGMHLKSWGSASSISAPGSAYRFQDFAAQRGIPYHDTELPITRGEFVEYGRAYQRRLVPTVEPKMLTTMHAGQGGYELRFDDGERVRARRVVIATGGLAFKHVPATLQHLPRSLVSHSSDWGELEVLKGRETIVLGAGASALDIAAELWQRQARVSVLARCQSVAFVTPLPANRNILKQLYRPYSAHGPGWQLRLFADFPALFHMLPEKVRLAKINSLLGPLGSYWVKDTIRNHVPLTLGRVIERAEARGERVLLYTRSRSGEYQTIEADHLVAATGFKVDLRRLPFLDRSLRSRIRMTDHTPILSAGFESSVEGLYFAGVVSAPSFGPLLRFVHGTHFTAPLVAKHLARRLVRRVVSIPQIVAPAQ